VRGGKLASANSQSQEHFNQLVKQLESCGGEFGVECCSCPKEVKERCHTLWNAISKYGTINKASFKKLSKALEDVRELKEDYKAVEASNDSD